MDGSCFCIPIEAPCRWTDPFSGCPQGIARKGNYGAYLQDDWDTIKALSKLPLARWTSPPTPYSQQSVSTLHQNLSIPVTAKFRIFPSLTKTIAYAKMMEEAGAQILTCHGRTREMKGQATGLADWEVIREVKKAVSVPVFANGNILYEEDVERCLALTGCDGIMTAEVGVFVFVPTCAI
jgi:tRNA-dihydrouridine synthase 1